MFFIGLINLFRSYVFTVLLSKTVVRIVSAFFFNISATNLNLAYRNENYSTFQMYFNHSVQIATALRLRETNGPTQNKMKVTDPDQINYGPEDEVCWRSLVQICESVCSTAT